MIEGPWSQLLSGIRQEHIHSSPFLLYITKIKYRYLYNVQDKYGLNIKMLHILNYIISKMSFKNTLIRLVNGMLASSLFAKVCAPQSPY